MIYVLVSPDGWYTYRVMPFGIKKISAKLSEDDECLVDLDGISMYVVDIMLYSDTWEEHQPQICQVFDRLETPTWQWICPGIMQSKIIYLGDVFGGEVSPVDAKVQTSVLQPISEADKGSLAW